MEYKLYHKAPYDDIERYGGLMEVSSPCSRFERRYDFDAFSISPAKTAGTWAVKTAV